MRVPRARMKFTKAVDKAVDNYGEWQLYREMNETTSLQTARKLNTPVGADGFVFGVGDDGNLYIKYEG